LSRTFFHFLELFFFGVPLASDSIIHPGTLKVNMANCTKMGKRIIQTLCKLPIDKLLGLWYNGNNARLGRGRATEKAK